MRKLCTIFLLSGMLFAMPAHADEAHGQKGKMCSMNKAECQMKCGVCPICGKEDCGVATPCPITQKFFMKSCFFLTNADEIGLSEDQMKQIKMLKNEVKKQALRDMAEWKIAEMDMKEKMGEDKVDTAALGVMVDQMSQAMTSSTKKTIEAYAKLKDVLSADQKSKAKAIWKKNA